MKRVLSILGAFSGALLLRASLIEAPALDRGQAWPMGSIQQRDGLADSRLYFRPGSEPISISVQDGRLHDVFGKIAQQAKAQLWMSSGVENPPWELSRRGGLPPSLWLNASAAFTAQVRPWRAVPSVHCAALWGASPPDQIFGLGQAGRPPERIRTGPVPSSGPVWNDEGSRVLVAPDSGSERPPHRRGIGPRLAPKTVPSYGHASPYLKSLSRRWRPHLAAGARQSKRGVMSP